MKTDLCAKQGPEDSQLPPDFHHDAAGSGTFRAEDTSEDEPPDGYCDVGYRGWAIIGVGYWTVGVIARACGGYDVIDGVG